MSQTMEYFFIKVSICNFIPCIVVYFFDLHYIYTVHRSIFFLTYDIIKIVCIVNERIISNLLNGLTIFFLLNNFVKCISHPTRHNNVLENFFFGC